MKIILSNRSGIPIYEQIKEQIKAAIYTNEIKEGEMLPSIRQLAKDLKISVITTTRAYTDLEQEGLIFTIQGKGCFVEPRDQELIKEQRLREIETHLANAIGVATIAGISKDEFIQLFNCIAKEEDYE